MSDSTNSCPESQGPFILTSSSPSQDGERRPYRCGSTLSEKDVDDLRSRYDIPTSVLLQRPRPTDRVNTPPPGLKTFFVVALDNGVRLPVHSYIVEALSMAGVAPFQLTQNMWISRSWIPLFHREDRHEGYFAKPLPPRDPGLFPPADANLGALKALRVSYSVPDHMPPLPPAVPVVASNQSPMRPPAPTPVLVGSSSEEEEAPTPLLRRPCPPTSETSMPNYQGAALESSGRGTSMPPSLEGHFSSSPLLLGSGWFWFGSSPNSLFGPLLSFRVRAYEASYVSARGFSPPPPPRIPKEDVVSSSKPSGLTVLRRLKRTTPSSSSVARNHAESIYSLSIHGDKFFGLHAVTFQSYKELISSYEVASGSSSRAEKYASGAPRIAAVRAELERMQAERDSALKERDHLQAGTDEILQTHDRLLDQLTESQRQVKIMEATRTLEGLGELVRSSDRVAILRSSHIIPEEVRAYPLSPVWFRDQRRIDQPVGEEELPDCSCR
ncbi:hypothetical protein LIER_23847 [Lithospermum erythrorhizon]|uniref:Uncharacterized protein n=1 Tax=Lithospermum erythrorhizon TaxID=34254 RepID=A0AAV3R4M4_LITER